MKKNIFLIILFSVVLLACSGENSPLIGAWYVHAINHQPFSVPMEQQAITTFKKDGTFLVNLADGTETQKGQWIFDEKDKNLVHVYINQSIMDWEITLLNSDSMQVDRKGSVFTWRKKK